MPLIGFTVFKDKVKNLEKRQTIRKLRKRPIKVGDKLYLYWKPRTKQCEHLRTEKCTEQFQITMSYFDDWCNTGKPIWRIDKMVHKGWMTLMDFKVEELAQRDGFKNALEMMQWFNKKYGDALRFITFQVIRW